jgi:hypothetical protein
MRVGRLAVALALSLISASLAWADVVLLDERVDRDEITEIRFNAPAGCVVTGLGLRAHADNITTMHCRYHRLLPDGTLVDPEEAHLGSEPEHGCEGKVLLPDGWVAVGFGAAGEPEWDVTLIRVWARQLNRDGTLGEVKAFNAGRRPDRGPERFVLIDETDRALTGVGIRFHHNDIMGIYGRSHRVLDLDDDARAKLRGLTVSGWLLDGLDDIDVDQLLADMDERGVGRLDVRLNGSQEPPLDEQVEALRDLASRCRKANVDIYLWATGLQPQRALRLVREADSLTGVVADASALSDESSPAARVGKVLESCRQENLRLYLRTDRVHDWMRDVPKDVAVVLSPDAAGDYPEQESLAGREVLAGLQIADDAALAAGLPDVRIAEVAGRIADAALAGARGFIPTVHSGGQYLPGSVSAIGLDAVDRLVADPLLPTDALWDELCAAHYGDAGPQAEFVLQAAASANNLIFGMLGLRLLWADGHLASVPQARERLHLLAEARAERTQLSARSLLKPSDKVADQVKIEGDTAQWHVRQCVAVADEAAKAAPGPAMQELGDAVARLQQSARLSQVASTAFIQTQLYAQDAAPRTLEAAEGALNHLSTVAEEVSAATGDSPMVEGVETFIASARESLEESPKKAPIAQAFRRVRDLSADGRDNEAAQALADILSEPEFGDHLDKHWQTVGEIASTLPALGTAGGGLEIRWGGDGQWKLEKVGGRWCSMTHDKGPCIYFNVPGEPLDPAADYVLSFEYFDQGDWELWAQYHSDFPADRNPTYYPAGPLQLKDTRTWKEGSLALPRCRFGDGQNMVSDLRFLSGKGMCIRNVGLTPK